MSDTVTQKHENHCSYLGFSNLIMNTQCYNMNIKAREMLLNDPY